MRAAVVLPECLNAYWSYIWSVAIFYTVLATSRLTILERIYVTEIDLRSAGPKTGELLRTNVINAILWARGTSPMPIHMLFS